VIEVDRALKMLNSSGVRIACQNCSKYVNGVKGPAVLIPVKKDTQQVRRALGQIGMSRLPIFRVPVDTINKQRCQNSATGE
jgi:hypothetical protein